MFVICFIKLVNSIIKHWHSIPIRSISNRKLITHIYVRIMKQKLSIQIWFDDNQ